MRPVCRDMRDGEEESVLALVLRSFDGSVRDDFAQEGVREFIRAARCFVLQRPPSHAITVASVGGTLIGMIDVRDGCHISLFFVEPAVQRQGVGRALLEAAIERALCVRTSLEALAVNSAPSAVAAYLALGFVPTAAERELNGIRFVAMRKELPGGRLEDPLAAAGGC